MTGHNPAFKPYKVAVLWRGDAEARKAATPQNNRFYRIFEELAAVGIHAEPAVYDETVANEVREQLLAANGVLVWVDPIHQGKTRAELDPLLRDVAARGPWVSAHPDVILQMGVKEVLYRTKHLGWGTDTHVYRTAAEFLGTLPVRLRASGPRVIKQNRAKAYGRSSCCPASYKQRGSACCMHNVGAYHGIYHFRSSSHPASPISVGADASSISRFSHACSTA